MGLNQSIDSYRRKRLTSPNKEGILFGLDLQLFPGSPACWSTLQIWGFLSLKNQFLSLILYTWSIDPYLLISRYPFISLSGKSWPLINTVLQTQKLVDMGTGYQIIITNFSFCSRKFGSDFFTETSVYVHLVIKSLFSPNFLITNFTSSFKLAILFGLCSFVVISRLGIGLFPNPIFEDSWPWFNPLGVKTSQTIGNSTCQLLSKYLSEFIRFLHKDLRIVNFFESSFIIGSIF